MLRGRRLTLFVLFVICLIGVVFRFVGLDSQGFIGWDEAMYLNEAVFYDSVVSNAGHIVQGLVNGSLSGSGLEEMIAGWPPSSAKPLHSVLIFVVSLFVGLGPFAGQAMSAFFGILSIPLVYLLVSPFYGRLRAGLAAFFLSISAYHVYVSRLATPEADSIFFLLLSVVIYLRYARPFSKHEKKWLSLSGIVLSLSLLCCYRWVIVLPVWVLAECIFGIKRRSIRSTIVRLVILGVSVLIIPCIVDLPYLVLALFSDVSVQFQSIGASANGFFAQIVYYLFFQGQSGDYLLHPLYLHFFIMFSGVVWTCLALAGLSNVAWRRRIVDLFVMGIPCIVLIFLSIKTRGNAIRYASLAIPFLCIASAVCLGDILSIVKRRWVRITVLVSFIAAIGVVNVVAFARYVPAMRSGYVEAMAYIETLDGGENHLATTNSISEFYLGRNVADALPRSREAIIEKLATGEYKYVVIDYMMYRVAPSLAPVIHEKAMPIHVIPNPMGSNIIMLMESLHYRHGNPTYLSNALNDPRSAYIEIYRAEDILAALSE